MPRPRSGGSPRLSSSVVRPVASGLGTAAVSHFCASPWEFGVAVSVPGNALRAFVDFVLASRVNRRTRRTLPRLDAALMASNPEPPKWVQTALVAAFNLYCCVRMAAAPPERQPAMFRQDGISLPQGLVRDMRRFGVTWLSERQRASIADRVQNRFDEIFSAIQSGPHVVWFDNYYRRQYAINLEKGDVS